LKAKLNGAGDATHGHAAPFPSRALSILKVEVMEAGKNPLEQH
jgi:hypothetical protein